MTDHMSSHGRDAEWVYEVLRQEIASLRELILEKFDGQAKALELQAGEYERRLGDLNNAHRKAEEERGKVVSTDKFEGFLLRYDEDRKNVAEALTLAAGNKAGTSTTVAYIFAALGAVGVLISLVLVVGDVLTP